MSDDESRKQPADGEPPAKKAKKQAKKKEAILTGIRGEKMRRGGGFRDKQKLKVGVINYVFRPKDNSAYKFSELEVVEEWPARDLQYVKVHPTNPTVYEPGQHVHFNVMVPANCFMRFSPEPLCGVVGLVMNEGGAGQQPQARRLAPMRFTNHDDDFDADVQQANANRIFAPIHYFVPESPAGGILPFIERVEVLVHNTVAKVFQISGPALQRYMGLAVRSAKKKFGPDMDSLATACYLPLTEKDMSHEAPSLSRLRFAREFRRAKNEKYFTRSPLYTWPFGYDPVVKQIHDEKDLDSLFFGPGTHLEIKFFLASNFSRSLRSVAAGNPELNDEERRALWGMNQRAVLNSMYLSMIRQCFPPSSSFLKEMDAEFKRDDGRIYPFTEANELRTPVLPQMSEQTWPINLHLLNYPTVLYLSFSTNNDIDGSNGATINTTVWRFPPNLESLDITYQDTSLLPGGKLTKLDMPELDTIDKVHCFDDQKAFRRTPGTYDEFFDNGVQKYLVIKLSHMYLQESKLNELEPVHIQMKFNNQLSPAGWVTCVTAVTEKKLVLKPTGEHVIYNAAGKAQQQA